MAYGVLSTPGVVIDGKVVHAGGVPSRERSSMVRGRRLSGCKMGA